MTWTVLLGFAVLAAFIGYLLGKIDHLKEKLKEHEEE